MGSKNEIRYQLQKIAAASSYAICEMLLQIVTSLPKETKIGIAAVQSTIINNNYLVEKQLQLMKCGRNFGITSGKVLGKYHTETIGEQST